MKSIKNSTGIIAVAVVMTMAIAGCQSGSYSNENINFSSTVDSVSYIIGYNIGNSLNRSGMDNVNLSMIKKGMGVALSGDSSLIPPALSRALLTHFRMEAHQKVLQKRQQQAEQNKKKGQAFLAKNKKKEGVKTTESGLEYKILKEGQGVSPAKGDTVVVNYVGKHLNGDVFGQADSVTIALKSVITGWKEGMKLMKEGATFIFWIPGKLAYGTTGRQNRRTGKVVIEPNETLKFKVHLIKVK